MTSRFREQLAARRRRLLEQPEESSAQENVGPVPGDVVRGPQQKPLQQLQLQQQQARVGTPPKKKRAMSSSSSPSLLPLSPHRHSNQFDLTALDASPPSSPSSPASRLPPPSPALSSPGSVIANARLTLTPNGRRSRIVYSSGLPPPLALPRSGRLPTSPALSSVSTSYGEGEGKAPAPSRRPPQIRDDGDQQASRPTLDDSFAFGSEPAPGDSSLSSSRLSGVTSRLSGVTSRLSGVTSRSRLSGVEETPGIEGGLPFDADADDAETESFGDGWDGDDGDDDDDDDEFAPRNKLDHFEAERMAPKRMASSDRKALDRLSDKMVLDRLQAARVAQEAAGKDWKQQQQKQQQLMQQQQQWHRQQQQQRRQQQQEQQQLLLRQKQRQQEQQLQMMQQQLLNPRPGKDTYIVSTEKYVYKPKYAERREKTGQENESEYDEDKDEENVEEDEEVEDDEDEDDYRFGDGREADDEEDDGEVDVFDECASDDSRVRTSSKSRRLSSSSSASASRPFEGTKKKIITNLRPAGDTVGPGEQPFTLPQFMSVLRSPHNYAGGDPTRPFPVLPLTAPPSTVDSVKRFLASVTLLSPAAAAAPPPAADAKSKTKSHHTAVALFCANVCHRLMVRARALEEGGGGREGAGEGAAAEQGDAAGGGEGATAAAAATRSRLLPGYVQLTELILLWLGNEFPTVRSWQGKKLAKSGNITRRRKFAVEDCLKDLGWAFLEGKGLAGQPPLVAVTPSDASDASDDKLFRRPGWPGDPFIDDTWLGFPSFLNLVLDPSSQYARFHPPPFVPLVVDPKTGGDGVYSAALLTLVVNCVARMGDCGLTSIVRSLVDCEASFIFEELGIDTTNKRKLGLWLEMAARKISLLVHKVCMTPEGFDGFLEKKAMGNSSTQLAKRAERAKYMVTVIDSVWVVDPEYYVKYFDENWEDTYTIEESCRNFHSSYIQGRPGRRGLRKRRLAEVDELYASSDACSDFDSRGDLSCLRIAHSLGKTLGQKLSQFGIVMKLKVEQKGVTRPTPKEETKIVTEIEVAAKVVKRVGERLLEKTTENFNKDLDSSREAIRAVDAYIAAELAGDKAANLPSSSSAAAASPSSGASSFVAIVPPPPPSSSVPSSTPGLRSLIIENCFLQKRNRHVVAVCSSLKRQAAALEAACREVEAAGVRLREQEILIVRNKKAVEGGRSFIGSIREAAWG